MMRGLMGMTMMQSLNMLPGMGFQKFGEGREKGAKVADRFAKIKGKPLGFGKKMTMGIGAGLRNMVGMSTGAKRMGAGMGALAATKMGAKAIPGLGTGLMALDMGTGMLDSFFAPSEDEKRIEALKEKLKATAFGRKVSQLYIDPLSGVIIRKALESEVAANPLGLLHTITRTPDIYSLYVRKNEMETYLTHLMQMEADLMLPPPVEHTELEFYLWDLKTALLLMDWVEETPEEHLMKRYSTTPGDIRAKVETAGWILYSMSELSELISPNTTKMVAELEIRISNGVRKELLPLLEIDSIGRVRARSLFNAGFTSQSSIRDAKPSDLSEIPGIGKKLAEKLAGKKDPHQMRFELA